MKKWMILSLIAMILLPCSTSLADTFSDGGDRLVDMQQDDGGWDWPLNDGDPTDASATNTAGPIGMGLLGAYEQTGDTSYLTAAQEAGDFISTNSPPHSTGNGVFMSALSKATGDSSYVQDVKTEYYDALSNGTYLKNGTLYNITTYSQYIYDVRDGQGIGNLGTWDVGLAAAGAASVGVSSADLVVWGDAVESGLSSWEGTYSTGNSSYSVLSLAGGIYGMAACGQDLDATLTNSYLNGASSLYDLADILVTYQTDSGGFTKYADYVDDQYTGVQETSYAILALYTLDAELYASAISSAAQWLQSVQLATGGWSGSWAGIGSENNEITGEALWALSVAVPTPGAFLLSCLGLGVVGRLRRRK